MKSILRNLFYNNPDSSIKYSNEQKRTQRLLMIINFIVVTVPIFVIYDVVLAILNIDDFTPEKLPLIVFWLLFVIALSLAKKGAYIPAKLIIIYSPLILMSSYSIMGEIIGEHFLWQPVMVLGMSIVPFLVLDVRKDRPWLIFVFTSFLIFVVFHNDIMLYGAKDSFAVLFDKLNTTPFVYNSVRIIIFLFLTLIIYYSVNLNDQQNLINEKINESLITTSKNLEVANAELNAQRNAINKSASLIITDEFRKIVTVNDNFLNLSGYTLQELIGIKAHSLISDNHDEDFFSVMSQTIESGRVWRGELKNSIKGGGYFWMQTAISPIFYQDKKQKGYLVIMFDITKLKEDEERLERLNYEKDRILYAVAHDLKNPLLNFKALLDLIKSGAVKKDEEAEVFRLMTKDCDHSTNLISELLEIGRLEDENFVLEKQLVNLSEFLENALEQFENNITKKSIRFVKNFESDLKPIKLNEREFIRVVNNLISNAIKFTPEEGEINITTKCISNDKVSIEISDTGIGISEELLPNIFDKFSKARRKGIKGENSTGLGMWIVKHIIRLHSGEISVKSIENIGTTFTIILPA